MNKVTLGQILDLIDESRDSEEYVEIMEDGKVAIRAMVCSWIWLEIEGREVNSIAARDDVIQIWLD